MRIACVLLSSLVLLAASTAATDDITASPICHNASGSCRHDGTFLCMSGNQSVTHAQRCDGNTDCDDTTDEFLCDLPADPIFHDHALFLKHEQALARKHNVPKFTNAHEFYAQAFAGSTCIGCNCLHGGPLDIIRGNPWFDFAIKSRPSANLADNFVPHTLGCNGDHTDFVKLQLFRKTGYCKHAVCCSEQIECSSCNSFLYAPAKKCWP